MTGPRELLDRVDGLAVSGRLDEAIAAIAHAAAEPDAPPEVRFRHAELLRERGDAEAALEAARGLLDTDAGRLDALGLAVEIHVERGEPEDALALLDRAEQAGARGDALAELRTFVREAQAAGPPDDDAAGEPPAGPELVPDEADLRHFMQLFQGREDDFAVQWWNPARGRSGYSPAREPLTGARLLRHFLGEETLGIYLIRLDDTCSLFVVDIDIPYEVLDTARLDHAFARRLAETLKETTATLRDKLAELGFQPIVEDSGQRGRHVWAPLARPVAAAELHAMGRGLVGWLRGTLPPGLLDVEFFPKQARRRGGYGNLVKLPLGIHRKTGRRSVLLDEEGRPIERPFTWLRRVRPAPPAAVAAAVEYFSIFADPLEEEAGEQAAPPPAEPAEDVLPAPPAPGPAWTEADFETHPDVSWLLGRCGLLRSVVRGALERGRLDAREANALRHTLGHLDEAGVLAVNYLLDRAGRPPDERLKSPLRGHPTSCRKLGRRFPEHARAGGGCTCRFPWADVTTPTPLLHLDDPRRAEEIATEAGPATEEVAPPDAELLLRRLAALERRIAGLSRERDEVARALAAVLRARPEGALEVTEGVVRLVEREGIEELVWEPARREGDEDGGEGDEAADGGEVAGNVPRFRVELAVKGEP